MAASMYFQSQQSIHPSEACQLDNLSVSVLAFGRSGNQIVCGSPRSSAFTSECRPLPPDLLSSTLCVFVSANMFYFFPFFLFSLFGFPFLLDDGCFICAWAKIPLRVPRRTSKKRSHFYIHRTDIFTLHCSKLLSCSQARHPPTRLYKLKIELKSRNRIISSETHGFLCVNVCVYQRECVCIPDNMRRGQVPFEESIFFLLFP